MQAHLLVILTEGCQGLTFLALRDGLCCGCLGILFLSSDCLAVNGLVPEMILCDFLQDSVLPFSFGVLRAVLVRN